VDPFIVGLVLLSAAIHPLWNALAKGELQPEAAFLNLLVVSTLCALAHCLIAGAPLLSVLEAWPIMAASASGLSLYCIALIITLRRGDLSVYYPIVRSSPVFVVAAGFLVLGERYAPTLLFGIALVICGAFLIQYRRGAGLLHDRVTFFSALLAMCGTGIYAIADSRAILYMQPMVVFFWQTMPTTVLFWCYLLRFGSMPPGEVANAVRAGWRSRPHRFLGTGVLVYISYYLILIAYERGGNVAAVTSVRQASIPISVLLGIVMLRETGFAWRLSWSLVIAIGIAIIVTSR
jgi:drug/metabolite transporter (DMT)-like permease